MSVRERGKKEVATHRKALAKGWRGKRIPEGNDRDGRTRGARKKRSWGRKKGVVRRGETLELFIKQ